MSTDRHDPLPLSAADADPELLELLEAGRSELPTDAQLGALAAKIGPLLGPPSAPPGPMGGSGAGGAGVGAGGAVAAWKLIIAIGVVGVGGLGAWWAWAAKEGETAGARPAAVVSAPRDVAEAVAAAPSEGEGDPPAAVAIAAPAEERSLDVEANPASGSAAGSGVRRRAAGTTTLGRAGDAPAPPLPAPPPVPTEMELLNRAQSALRGDPAAALEALELHGSLHPSGVLAQEREVLAIEALYRMGRGAEAERRASRFESRWPASAQIRRIHVLRTSYGAGTSAPKS